MLILIYKFEKFKINAIFIRFDCTFALTKTSATSESFIFINF